MFLVLGVGVVFGKMDESFVVKGCGVVRWFGFNVVLIVLNVGVIFL